MKNSSACFDILLVWANIFNINNIFNLIPVSVDMSRADTQQGDGYSLQKPYSLII